MADLHFELVTPERLVRSDDVHMVVVPGIEGEFGVMAGHAPFMTTLKDGELKVYKTAGGAAGEHRRIRRFRRGRRQGPDRACRERLSLAPVHFRVADPLVNCLFTLCCLGVASKFRGDLNVPASRRSEAVVREAPLQLTRRRADPQRGRRISSRCSSGSASRWPGSKWEAIFVDDGSTDGTPGPPDRASPRTTAGSA